MVPKHSALDVFFLYTKGEFVVDLSGDSTFSLPQPKSITTAVYDRD
jgi:hypothetical protein